MKIMLITPVIKSQCRWIPLGPGYLSGVLRKNGHQTRLFDRAREFAQVGDLVLLDAKMLKEMEEFRPDVVALSTISPVIYDTGRCATAIRNHYNGLLVAGGHHATAMPQLTLERIPELDAVVTGEGEYPLLGIANQGANAPLPGVLWRGQNRDVFNYQVANLDELPFPDFSLYDMDYYLARNASTIRGFYLSTLSLLTSRGCKNKCGFCSESLTFGGGVRFNSPDYVIEMIEDSMKQYDFNGVYFHDNDFLADKARAEKICLRLINKKGFHGLKWCIQTRASSIDSEIVRLLKRAGCVKVEIGIESAVQSQLNNAEKGLTLSAVEKAIRLCHQGGIKVHGYFIGLLPGDTLENLHLNIETVKRLKLDSFLCGRLQLYPGTKFYQKYGNSFFENCLWDEVGVKEFYESDCVSCVSGEEWESFEKTAAKPLGKRLHRRELLLNNKPWKVAEYAVNRKTKHWKKKYLKINLVPGYKNNRPIRN